MFQEGARSRAEALRQDQTRWVTEQQKASLPRRNEQEMKSKREAGVGCCVTSQARVRNLIMLYDEEPLGSVDQKSELWHDLHCETTVWLQWRELTTGSQFTEWKTKASGLLRDLDKPLPHLSHLFVLATLCLPSVQKTMQMQKKLWNLYTRVENSRYCTFALGISLSRCQSPLLEVY